MRINWLYTTAMALVIGAGPAIAQSPEGSQREESPRAQSPASQSREMDRPAAPSKEMDRGSAADRIKERAQSESKGGAKDMQRGEAPSPAERSKEAQKPQDRDSQEPTRAQPWRARTLEHGAAEGPAARPRCQAGCRPEATG